MDGRAMAKFVRESDVDYILSMQGGLKVHSGIDNSYSSVNGG